MITNAVCTIVRTAEDGSYYAGEMYPCLWIEDNGYEAKKYGEEKADTARIYISDVKADVLEGDYITKAVVPEVITDVSGMLAVKNVAHHDYGSAEMQHTEVGAK